MDPVLLSIASGLLGSRRGQEMSGLSRGLLAGYEMKQRDAERQQVEEHRQAQLRLLIEKMEQDQRKQAAAQRAQQEAQKRMQSAFTDPYAIFGKTGQVPPQDDALLFRRGALAAGEMGDSESAKRYGEIAEKMGKRVKSQEERMLNGKLVTVLTYEDGTQEVSPYSPLPKRKFVDTKDGVTVADELTTPVGTTFRYGQSPDNKASTGLGYAQLKQRKAEHDYETQQGPKAPTGYQWNAARTGLEPIAGGPHDTSKTDASRREAALAKADIVLGKVAEATEQTGFGSTGLTGAALGVVPGTGAYDLRRTVDTIKANIGFQELQAMREASPTGGALGQVAIQELQMLQSTVASLDANQSEPQLRAALAKVGQHFTRWKQMVERGQRGSAGATGGWSIEPAQ